MQKIIILGITGMLGSKMLETFQSTNKYKVYFTIMIIGFGRAVSEYGAAAMVGGSIDHVTKNITATIAQETSKGNLYLALQLGIILISISFALSFLSQISNKN